MVPAAEPAAHVNDSFGRLVQVYRTVSDGAVLSWERSPAASNPTSRSYRSNVTAALKSLFTGALVALLVDVMPPRPPSITMAAPFFPVFLGISFLRILIGWRISFVAALLCLPLWFLVDPIPGVDWAEAAWVLAMWLSLLLAALPGRTWFYFYRDRIRDKMRRIKSSMGRRVTSLSEIGILFRSF